MKKHQLITLLLIISFKLTVAMHEQGSIEKGLDTESSIVEQNPESENDNINQSVPLFILPIELLVQISLFTLLDSNAISDSNLDILDAIEHIKKNLTRSCKDILLICKLFSTFKANLLKSNLERIKFYRQLIKEQLLTHCQNSWHPKKCNWTDDFITNLTIGKFLSEESPNDSILCCLITASEKSLKLFQLLIFYGASIEGHNSFGQTALILAAGDNQTEILKFLLDKGANINTQDTMGTTALVEAASLGNIETVKLLLAYNANTDIQDNECKTALNWASPQNHIEIVDLIEQHMKEHAACAICLDKNCNVKAQCNHFFHEECLAKWFMHDNTCPVCRE